MKQDIRYGLIVMFLVIGVKALAQTPPILINTNTVAEGAGLISNGAVVILRETQIQYDNEGNPVMEVNEYGKEVPVREPRDRAGKIKLTHLAENYNLENPLLFVEGLVTKRARIYNDNIEWADYVFEESYNLISLSSLESFIKENGHLPAIPSAQEVKENGYSIAEMHHQFLRTMEEMTLHQLAMETEIEKLRAKTSGYRMINSRIEKLKSKLGIESDLSSSEFVVQSENILQDQVEPQASINDQSDNRGKVGINVNGLENNTVLNISGRVIISNNGTTDPDLNDEVEINALATYDDDLTEHDIVFAEDENGNRFWEDRGIRKFHPEDFLVYVNGEIVVTDYVSTNLAEHWDNEQLDMGSNAAPMPLNELREFIEQNGHLPGIPSQESINNNKGYEVNMIAMAFKRNLEDQFKYLISQRKQITSLRNELSAFASLEDELRSINKRLEVLND